MLHLLLLAAAVGVGVKNLAETAKLRKELNQRNLLQEDLPQPAVTTRPHSTRDPRQAFSREVKAPIYNLFETLRVRFDTLYQAAERLPYQYKLLHAPFTEQLCQLLRARQTPVSFQAADGNQIVAGIINCEVHYFEYSSKHELIDYAIMPVAPGSGVIYLRVKAGDSLESLSACEDQINQAFIALDTLIGQATINPERDAKHRRLEQFQERCGAPRSSRDGFAARQEELSKHQSDSEAPTEQDSLAGLNLTRFHSLTQSECQLPYDPAFGRADTGWVELVRLFQSQPQLVELAKTSLFAVKDPATNLSALIGWYDDQVVALCSTYGYHLCLTRVVGGTVEHDPQCETVKKVLKMFEIRRQKYALNRAMDQRLPITVMALLKNPVQIINMKLDADDPQQPDNA